MAAVTFGADAPCRACHGAGELVYAMTAAAQRERQRELRRAKRNGETLEPMPKTKPCRSCAGNGFVPISVADRP